MQVASVLAPLGGIVLWDFAPTLITLVAAHDDFAPRHVNARSFHFLFPVDERLERITIVNIVNHDYAICVLVKLGSNEFVFFVAREIKEVN